MADNVPITAGTGTSIATDDVGGVHYQVIKNAFGALDTATLVTATVGMPVQQVRAATGTTATVASSATSVTLQASNANRLGWMVYNDSTANLFVRFAATASSANFTVKLGPGGYYEMPNPIYTGIIDGIWDVANGNARVTELT